MEIEEVTIVLHTGLKDIMDKQIKLLEPLNKHLKIHWNNRYERHPESYDSYSEMINEAICTSPTEFIVLINDRVIPKVSEVLLIIELLEKGFAASTCWSIAFMGVSKELFRTIGWLDQRFLGGGFEDDDFVLRLKLADLAYYESSVSEYDKSFKSPLRIKGGDACSLSGPHFYKKWLITHNEVKRVMIEEKYQKWDGMVGGRNINISNSWKHWEDSIVGIGSPPFGTTTALQGESRTYWFMNWETGAVFKNVKSI